MSEKTSLAIYFCSTYPCFPQTARRPQLFPSPAFQSTPVYLPNISHPASSAGGLSLEGSLLLCTFMCPGISINVCFSDGDESVLGGSNSNRTDNASSLSNLVVHVTCTCSATPVNFQQYGWLASDRKRRRRRRGGGVVAHSSHCAAKDRFASQICACCCRMPCMSMSCVSLIVMFWQSTRRCRESLRWWT